MPRIRQPADSPAHTDREDFERLFHLSLDLLCIAGFDGYFKRLNSAWENTLGYTLDELMSAPYTDFVHPDDRAATLAEAAQLNRGKHTISFANRSRSRDGSSRWLLWSATSAADRQRVYAVARDITARKRAEQRLAAGYSLTRVIEESVSLSDAAPHILQALCDTLDLGTGVFWQADTRASELRCAAIRSAGPGTPPAFDAETRQAVLHPGDGLPGRVWAEGRSISVADVAGDAALPRDFAAVSAGLHSAFAFPIRTADGAIGVMEFFSRDMRAPDEDLLTMLDSAGRQIGQFVERRRTESELKEYAASLEEARREQEATAARLTRPRACALTPGTGVAGLPAPAGLDRAGVAGGGGVRAPGA